MTYISLLRGINVSGQKKILMSDLKLLYENLGFTQVKTYIQSGNVVFCAPKSHCTTLSGQISSAIASAFGFPVPTITLELAHFHQILHTNPFAILHSYAPAFYHISFLSTPATPQAITGPPLARL